MRDEKWLFRAASLYRMDLIVFLMAAAVRGWYLTQYNNDPFYANLLLDSEYYDRWASEIAAGNWLGNRVFFVSPLYAYFLAAFHAVFKNAVPWVYAAQFLLGSFHCVIIYRLGKRLFGDIEGLAAGLLSAFYGHFIFMEGLILKTSLAYTLSSLTILVFLRAAEGEKKAPWIAVGVLAGLTALIIPNFLIFSICVPIAMISDRKRDFKPALMRLAVFSAGLFIVIAPVAYRNYHVGSDMVLISYNGGFNLFLGTDRETDGGAKRSGIVPPIPAEEERAAALTAEGAENRQLTASEVSRYWSNRAVAQIRSDPAWYLGLMGRKLYRLFNWREVADNLDFYYFSDKYRILDLPFMNFGTIVTFGFLGMWLSRREYGKLTGVYLFMVLFGISLLPFAIFARYRAPLVPLFMVFAAYATRTIVINPECPIDKEL